MTADGVRQPDGRSPELRRHAVQQGQYNILQQSARSLEAAVGVQSGQADALPPHVTAGRDQPRCRQGAPTQTPRSMSILSAHSSQALCRTSPCCRTSVRQQSDLRRARPEAIQVARDKEIGSFAARFVSTESASGR